MNIQTGTRRVCTPLFIESVSNYKINILKISDLSLIFKYLIHCTHLYMHILSPTHSEIKILLLTYLVLSY